MVETGGATKGAEPNAGEVATPVTVPIGAVGGRVSGAKGTSRVKTWVVPTGEGEGPGSGAPMLRMGTVSVAWWEAGAPSELTSNTEERDFLAGGSYEESIPWTSATSTCIATEEGTLT